MPLDEPVLLVKPLAPPAPPDPRSLGRQALDARPEPQNRRRHQAFGSQSADTSCSLEAEPRAGWRRDTAPAVSRTRARTASALRP